MTHDSDNKANTENFLKVKTMFPYTISLKSFNSS